MAIFGYSDEIVAAFPTIRGGVVHAAGIVNGPAPPPLTDAYRAEQDRVRDGIGDTPLAQLPSLEAWRRAFATFGVQPTRYRSAAEALLRRLTKRGGIPSINLLVDLANLVSIRHRLPVAVFDQRTVTGATTVRYAAGGEWFTDLGADTPTHPEAGEVIFVDAAALVSARRWCWRQSAQSAAGPATVEVLITVEGHHPDAAADVATAVEDLMLLLAEYQPQASVARAALSPGAPRFAS